MVLTVLLLISIENSHAILQFKSPKRVTEILKKKFMMIADKKVKALNFPNFLIDKFYKILLKVYPIPAYQEFFQDYPELGEERDDEETDMLAFEIKNGLQLNITFKTEPKYEELRKLPGFHSASIPRSKQLSRIVLFKNLESLEEAQDILSQQKNVESAQLMGFRSVSITQLKSLFPLELTILFSSRTLFSLTVISH